MDARLAIIRNTSDINKKKTKLVAYFLFLAIPNAYFCKVSFSRKEVKQFMDNLFKKQSHAKGSD